MHLSAWTYPWDVARLGVDAVLADLARAGIGGIDLAASYHPLSAISPRGTLTPFFSPAGAVFFPARAARYGAIAPHLHPERSVLDVWPAVAERLDAHGLELAAWTICLFQPWMAQRHPETARVYVTGARLDTGVCGSNPLVRAYLAALVGDVVDQFPVGLVKLEGIAPPRFDYGWTRRRLYADLTPLQEDVLSACFCPSCRRAATDAGIDVTSVERVAIDALAVPAGPEPAGAADLLAAYADIARASAGALVRELAQVAHRAGARIGVATPIDGTAPGVDLAAVIDDVDVIMLAGLPKDRARLAEVAELRAAAATPPALEYFLHPPFSPAGAGGLPGGIRDDLADPAWLAALGEALALGADRLSLYNYGLLPAPVFERLAGIAREVGSTGRPALSGRGDVT